MCLFERVTIYIPNVCCKMLPLSWHSFDDIAKLITTCCPNDGLAMAVAVGR